MPFLLIIITILICFLNIYINIMDKILSPEVEVNLLYFFCSSPDLPWWVVVLNKMVFILIIVYLALHLFIMLSEKSGKSVRELLAYTNEWPFFYCHISIYIVLLIITIPSPWVPLYYLLGVPIFCFMLREIWWLFYLFYLNKQAKKYKRLHKGWWARALKKEQDKEVTSLLNHKVFFKILTKEDLSSKEFPFWVLSSENWTCIEVYEKYDSKGNCEIWEKKSQRRQDIGLTYLEYDFLRNTPKLLDKLEKALISDEFSTLPAWQVQFLQKYYVELLATNPSSQVLENKLYLIESVIDTRSVEFKSVSLNKISSWEDLIVSTHQKQVKPKK